MVRNKQSKTKTLFKSHLTNLAKKKHNLNSKLSEIEIRVEISETENR